MCVLAVSPPPERLIARSLARLLRMPLMWLRGFVVEHQILVVAVGPQRQWPVPGSHPSGHERAANESSTRFALAQRLRSRRKLTSARSAGFI